MDFTHQRSYYHSGYWTGCQIGFYFHPPPPPQDRATVFQPCFSTTQTTTIDTEIESLLSLKVIAPSHQGNCLWISPIFTTTNSTSRLILNLKKLNLLITYTMLIIVCRFIDHIAIIFRFCGKTNTITTSGFPMDMHRLH